MTASFRLFIVRLLPPILTEAIRALIHRRREPMQVPVEAPIDAEEASSVAASDSEPAEPAPLPEWEVVEDTDELWASLGGWDHPSIVQTQVDKWAAFERSVEGPGLLGQSHEGSGAGPDLATHNTLISFGYALARAGAGRDRISVLDWGGGLGHYYRYAQALLPDMAIDYTVKDVPGLCDAGRRLLPDVNFSSSDDVLGRSYDFTFASSSVHYERDPHAMLARLAASSREWLFMTRTPIVERSDDLLVVQRPHAYGYMTEYAGWVLNRARLLSCLHDVGFALDRQFLIGEQPYLPMLSEQPQYYGFLFRRS